MHSASLPLPDHPSPTTHGGSPRHELRAGLILVAALALAALALARIQWLGAHGFSALTVAIVLGMLVGNSPFRHSLATYGHGITYSKQTILRAGVVLYGLRLTLHDVANVGAGGVLVDTVMLSSTFLLSWIIGTRLLKLDHGTAILIGAGSSICGAAAVMATEPIARGRAESVAVAVATVVVFGTIGIFLYPALYALNLHYGLLPSDTKLFGIYIGSTVHEVAQVFAAGRSISLETANTAVITKMVRVMMLAPFLIALSAWLSRNTFAHATAHQTAQKTRITIPWFAVAFCGVVLLNSVLPTLHMPHLVAARIDDFLLAMAMAALGLGTHASAIRRAGLRPLLLAALLFTWLVVGGAMVNRLVLTHLA